MALETRVEEELLADVAALVSAIDAEDAAASSPLDAFIPEYTEGASLFDPFEAGGDEWLLFSDIFDAETGPEVTKVEPTVGVLSEQSDSHVVSKQQISTARVKSSRDRQKAELVYLRDRVAELENQLQVLKAEKAANEAAAEEGEGGQECQVVTRDGARHFWQRQAEGERRVRERSIAENARLRQALEAQLRIATSLGRLLRKRTSDPHALTVLSDATTKRNRLHDAGDAEIYEFLLRDMDVRYAQVDTVLRESGLSARRDTYEDARFVERKRDRSHATPWYLEFVDSGFAPFGYALVRDVVWRAMCTPTVPLDSGVYEVIEATNDVIKAEFRINMRMGNANLLGRGRFVTRRYIEENRLVLTSAVWSTAEGGTVHDQQVRLIEESWGVVSPFPTSDEQAPGQSCSLIQRCGRMRPNMAIKKNSKLEAHVGMLTDVLLNTYHDILRGLNDHMGRMMVEAAAAAAAGSSSA